MKYRFATWTVRYASLVIRSARLEQMSGSPADHTRCSKKSAEFIDSTCSSRFKQCRHYYCYYLPKQHVVIITCPLRSRHCGPSIHWGVKRCVAKSLIKYNGPIVHASEIWHKILILPKRTFITRSKNGDNDKCPVQIAGQARNSYSSWKLIQWELEKNLGHKVSLVLSILHFKPGWKTFSPSGLKGWNEGICILVPR